MSWTGTSGPAMPEMVAMGIPRGVLEQALEGEVLYDEPMSRHTSYRIGGPADVTAVSYTHLTLPTTPYV